MEVRKHLLYLCFAAVLLSTLCWPAAAETWDVDGTGIEFHLNNYTLTMTNWNPQVQLHMVGDWAACGTVGSGLIRDPYATFVYNSQRNGGYIRWAPNTPQGYSCQLMLGRSWPGNGAQTYSSYYWVRGSGGSYSQVYTGSASGTLVWEWIMDSNGGGGYDVTDVGAAQNVFWVTAPQAVPEPSSIAALLSGLAGSAWLIIRRKK